MGKGMYSAADIQELTGLSRSATYALIQKLPPDIIYRLGKCVRVDIKGFEEYLKKTHETESQE